MPNSSEISDHNTVIGTFVIAQKTENGEEEPVNYHKSDLPLYNLEDIGEEGWAEVNKILSNQSWEGIAEMAADKLQEMIMNRYVEAVSQVAKKKLRKPGKKKTPPHLRKFIRMKRKAGKLLKNKKNLTQEKIKEILKKIKLADLGIQNAARQKQEREEKSAYERIKNE